MIANPPFPCRIPGIEEPPKTLAELRGIEPNAVPWHHLEWMIVAFMLAQSGNRRMGAGPDGLLEGAARTFLTFTMRDIAKARHGKGALFLWDASMIEHLVSELASELQRSAKLKRETMDMLAQHRNTLWDDDELTKQDPNIKLNNKDEDVVITLSRTLDYIEHIKAKPNFAGFIHLKRECLSCFRVINAVFTTDY
jgi:hypothetical protein